MRCPYCRQKGIDNLREECTCQNCNNLVGIGVTDFIRHAPIEISDDLPDSTKFGSITYFVYKKNSEKFCSRCGEVYQKDVKLCPSLVKMIKFWHKNPQEIIKLDSNLTEEIIKARIKEFVSRNFKRKKAREIFDTK